MVFNTKNKWLRWIIVVVCFLLITDRFVMFLYKRVLHLDPFFKMIVFKAINPAIFSR
jgi:hypothetical protein